MKFTVVGSGFAGSVISFFLLKNNHYVDMVDIGYDLITNNKFNNLNFNQIKAIDNSYDYFFGFKNQSLINFYDSNLYKIS